VEPSVCRSGGLGLQRGSEETWAGDCLRVTQYQGTWAAFACGLNTSPSLFTSIRCRLDAELVCPRLRLVPPSPRTQGARKGGGGGGQSPVPGCRPAAWGYLDYSLPIVKKNTLSAIPRQS